jgi:RNA polymerase sigma-70 factor, ECF subfamily
METITMTDETRAAIRKIRAGDPRAYDGIVRAYQQEIWRIVAFALQDPGATEDLVQQVFVRAFTRLDMYDETRDFGAWLRTIARNLVRNAIRHRVREQDAMQLYGVHMETRLEEDAGPDPAGPELRQALDLCRERLAPHAAQALALRYEQGLSFEEMAVVLDRTVAACRQLMVRVRLTLRQCIEERKSHE